MHDEREIQMLVLVHNRSTIGETRVKANALVSQISMGWRDISRSWRLPILQALQYSEAPAP